MTRRGRHNLKRQAQRGLKCSQCGKLKYFFDYEISRMNSSPGNRVQCQHCGHMHWDECPKSKRVKELKRVQIPTSKSTTGIEFL